ncbi:MAG: hypothetical protein GY696_38505 [Gammaproteobacteria bacterium]|nr:hypothetical protein [Gammaproteobacteria bacterium]
MKLASPLSPRGGNNIAIVRAPASPRGAGNNAAATIIKPPGSPRSTVAIIKAPGSPRGSPGTVVRVLSPRGAGSSSPSRITSPRVAAAGSLSPRIAAAGSLSPTKIALSSRSPIRPDIGPDLEDAMEVGISVEEVRTSGEDDKLSIAAMNTIARNLGPDISVKVRIYA